MTTICANSDIENKSLDGGKNDDDDDDDDDDDHDGENNAISCSNVYF